ncbi:MAG: hypothetical protein IJK14_00875 [Clostridia bacterium]|nr:hypothetical protein [Clostridia bacterium]
MRNLLCVLYLLIYIASGISLVRYCFASERPVLRIWLGSTAGLVMLLWFPALFSFVLGFTIAAQFLAALLAAAIGILFLILSKRREKTASVRERPPVLLLAALIPLAVLGIYLFSTHTILDRNGALYVGQSTYGDLCMHLGFITSITVQKTFPPFYSICPDTRIGYPFLSDSISSTFYTLGGTLRFAAILPAVYAYLLVLTGVYLFFEQWMERDGTKTVFCTLLFFVGGGFGFVYFFDLLKRNPGNFSRIFTAFYQTPTNNVDVGIKWVNPIADMLVPQRATLFGWALLFPCLYLLFRAFFRKEYRFFIPLGILAGSMPLVHTHSFLALGVISAVYLAESLLSRPSREELAGFLKYAALTVLLAAPQLILFTFRQSKGFLTPHFNWANETDGFLWFYIKNLGLLFLLLPLALFDTSSQNRKIMAGPAVLWLLAELIQFQPNPYDNNKLLFVCFAFLCGFIGDYLIRVFRKLRGSASFSRVSVGILSAFVCACLFLSGILTLGREAVSRYELLSADQVSAAEYIKKTAAPDATFLTANNHNNAVAVLTGRNIVCGSGSFLYYHGIDYHEREAALSAMYEDPESFFTEYAEKYDVDYVYLSYEELYKYDCDTDYFDSHFRVVYQNDEVTIYDVSQVL